MKKLILSLLLCACSHIIFACTTFCLTKNGHIVFGRNYDWVTGAGIVHTNHRGLAKTSMDTGDGPTTTWISKYGSITFNQYGKEFPMGGMNEKGLVVELMWLDGTIYPEPDKRPALGVLQWVQYQLDNATTTAEVLATDTRVRITSKGTPLHYLVADAAGNVATIEFWNGRMIVHKDQALPFPVLTNDLYASSVEVARPLLKNNTGTPPDNNSLDRFVKACSMVEKFRETSVDIPITDFAFSILDKVSQGSFTKWSIVYDISNKKIHFKSAGQPAVKTIHFSAIDLACGREAKMYNINQDDKGDISNKFLSQDKKLKQVILDQAITESSSRVTITKKEKQALLEYEVSSACN